VILGTGAWHIGGINQSKAINLAYEMGKDI